MCAQNVHISELILAEVIQLTEFQVAWVDLFSSGDCVGHNLIPLLCVSMATKVVLTSMLYAIKIQGNCVFTRKRFLVAVFQFCFF